MIRNHLFTSESVSEGHPDKVADQVSDAVVDAIFSKDPKARIACETLVTTGLVVIAGEVTTTATIDIPELARHFVAGAVLKARLAGQTISGRCHGCR